MLRIIGISGKPGSEKMFYAFKIIQELRYHGFKTHLISLAQPLYSEFNQIADSIKIENKDLESVVNKYNLGGKGKDLYNLISNNDLGEKHPDYGYSRRNEFVRKGLSLLGSGIRRKQNQDYFLEELVQNLPEGDFGVLIDLRYPNEADFINDNDGIVLRALRTFESDYGGYKYQEGMVDPTETALDNYEYFLDYLEYETFNRVDFAKKIIEVYGLELKEENIR